jgi:Cys-rich four helix bundle protein (predicted Tat secretion target)
LEIALIQVRQAEIYHHGLQKRLSIAMISGSLERTTMERRTFVTAAFAAATVLSQIGDARAQGAMSMHPPKYKALEEAAGRCVATANDCMRHCLGMMTMNDASMSVCANASYQVVAACGALQTLAAVNSAQLPAFAQAVGTICVACQKECGKFPQYAECKACGEACRDCAEACRKVAA